MSADVTEKEGLRARGPIRVTLPAAVAYDPDRLKKTLAGVLERIGCRACCSGADILLQMEREFLVDAEVNVTQARSVPEPAAAIPSGHQYVVALSPKVKFDIDRVFVAVDKVIDILGPHPCISGFDVLLRDELRTIVVDEQLNAVRLDRSF